MYAQILSKSFEANLGHPITSFSLDSEVLAAPGGIRFPQVYVGEVPVGSEHPIATQTMRDTQPPSATGVRFEIFGQGAVLWLKSLMSKRSSRTVMS